MSTMRLRLTLWGLLLALQLLVVMFPPEAVAPAVTGSIYLPLAILRWMGFPVLMAAESGGWAKPSLFGWAMVAVFWVALWWGVASVISSFAGRKINNA